MKAVCSCLSTILSAKTPSLSQDQFFPFARLFNSKDGVIYAVPHNVDNNSLPLRHRCLS